MMDILRKDIFTITLSFTSSLPKDIVGVTTVGCRSCVNMSQTSEV